MANFFYFFAIFFITYELMAVGSPIKTHLEANRRRATKRDELTRGQISHIFFNFFYVVWCLIGLFSSQWIIFIALLIWSNTIGLLSKAHFLIRLCNNLLYLSGLVFLVINKYHLHINVKEFLLAIVQ